MQRRRGPAERIGTGEGIRLQRYVFIVKSLRDHVGIDHEVVYRSSLGDGRYSYQLRCGFYSPAVRTRWKDRPVTCFACISKEEPDAEP